MPHTTIDSPVYLLGIDGGGTKTDIVLSDLALHEIRRVKISGTNPIDIGIDLACERLRNGMERICENIPYADIVLASGIAGGQSGDSLSQLNAFYDSFGFRAHTHDSDTQNIVRAALGERDGIIMIMGTGNCAIIQSGGNCHRMSGWGYLFDDGGCGYNIARDALAAHFRYVDGSGAHTAFSDAVSADHPEPQPLLGLLYQEGKRCIASFCPLVYACAAQGDEICQAILQKNMKYAADILIAAAKRLPPPVDIVLAGGLSSLPLTQHYLKEALPSHLHACIRVLENPPVYGALLRAQRLAQLQAKENL